VYFQVVHTVYWLSRKSSEFGISLAYYFDINNPTSHFTSARANARNSFLLKASYPTAAAGANINNFNKNSKANTKSNGSTHSTASSSSSSSPYFSSSSSSSLNQFSAASSLSASSSFTNSHSSSSSTTNSASLSVIVKQQQHYPHHHIQAPHSNALISSSPSSVSSNASSFNFLGKKSSFIEHDTTSSDEIITPVSPSNSTSLYECCVDNTNVKVPQSIKMSYIYKQQQQQHKNNLTPLKINSNSSDLPPPHEDSSRKNTDDSCSTTMSSPISSINGSSLVSPQSSNISTVQNIPTRFIDRRISTSALPVDPHKFNVKYSEVGQKIAQKAQEALKKTKDVDANEAIIQTISKRSEHFENGNGSGSGSGGGSASDDWQNVSFKKKKITTNLNWLKKFGHLKT
jgi:trimeric autotransporter adhesin